MTLDTLLAKHWLGVERSLTGDLERVAKNLTAARVRGINVSTYLLGADPGYLTLTAQLGSEARRYANTAATEISREMARSGSQGASEVRAYLKQLGVAGYAPGKSPDFVTTQARVRYLLEQGVGPDALDGMQKAMLRAVAKGESPAACVNAARTGMTRGLNRSLLVSRAETARSYTEAATAEMVASGQVEYKQRIVDRGGHPCPACLSRDGEVIPVAEQGAEHPSGRCRWKPVLRGQRALKRSAESWLHAQPAERQRDLLGDSRYEAFRDGRLSLQAFAIETYHPTYGRGLRVAPLPTTA